MNDYSKMTATELEDLSGYHDADPVARAIITELLGRYRELFRLGVDTYGRGGLEASDARNRLRRYIETLPEEPRS